MRPDRNERTGRRRRAALLWGLAILFAGAGLVLGQGTGPGSAGGTAPATSEAGPPKEAKGTVSGEKKPAGKSEARKPPSARPTEDVAAVVGNTPILRSEVEDQVKTQAEQMQADLSDTSVSNELHRQILQRMVDQQVLLLEAEAEGIKVTDEEINKAVDDEIDNNIRQLGGPDAFQDELKKEGMTEQELRSRYHEEARKTILAQRVIQKNVQPKVQAPDSAAIHNFYMENRDQIPKKPRQIRVQDLFVATRPDSAVSMRARENALEVRKKILAGMPFAEAAKTYSDDPRGKDGGSLGRVAKGQLDRDLDRAAFKLKVGEISEPVKTRFGYHLLTVTARDSDWVEVSHILFTTPSTKADEVAAKEKADQIYDDVVSGKIDFADAIRKYSDDPDSRARDGDMGWIPFDNFFGDMKTTVDSLRVGRLSRPVAGDGGYHIFKVTGEQAESNYAYGEIQDQLKQAAAQQAMENELQKWLTELRKKYFVEIRAHW